MSVPTSGNVRVVHTMVNAAGNVFQNVFHAQYTSLTDTDEDTLLALCSEYVEHVFDNWWDKVSQQFTVLPTKVYLRNTGTGEYDPIGDVAQPYILTAIGDPLPNQTAMLISFTTTGARVRGRMYLPPPVESENGGDGNPGASALAAAALVVAAFAGFVTLTDGNMAGSVLSRVNGLTYPVIGGTVGVYWATQRRRRPGVGM